MCSYVSLCIRSVVSYLSKAQGHSYIVTNFEPSWQTCSFYKDSMRIYKGSMKIYKGSMSPSRVLSGPKI